MQGTKIANEGIWGKFVRQSKIFLLKLIVLYYRSVGKVHITRIHRDWNEWNDNRLNTILYYIKMHACRHEIKEDAGSINIL